MTTRQEWAITLAIRTGNLKPNSNIIRFISAWTVGEGTAAKYNPLATTQPMPGATDFNSARVKNYLTYEQGITATITTLYNGYYPHILHGIQTNDVDEAMNAEELDIWGTHLGPVKAAYDSDRRLEGEALKSFESNITFGAPSDDEGKKIPEGTESAIIPGFPSGGTNGLGFSTPELPKVKDVLYVVLGIGMLGVALLLSIKTFVPTKQIVETVAKAAI